MAILIDHQPVSLPAGTRTAEAVVAGGQTILVRVARKTSATPTFWADAVSFALNVEVSADGGASWREACGFAAGGGIVEDIKTGNELAESRVSCGLPAGTNRVRVTLEIVGGTLVSQLTVESI